MAAKRRSASGVSPSRIRFNAPKTGQRIVSAYKGSSAAKSGVTRMGKRISGMKIGERRALYTKMRGELNKRITRGATIGASTKAGFSLLEKSLGIRGSKRLRFSRSSSSGGKSSGVDALGTVGGVNVGGF